MRIKGREISLLAVKDPFRLLDEPFIQEGFARDERMPYWADMWPCAASLAEFIFEMRDSGAFPPPRAGGGEGGDGCGWDAIEIGCGIGLAGIAAAMSGYRVLCTDQEERALTLARENAVRNGVGDRVGTAVFDWRDEPPGGFSILLASDCTYEQRNVEPIVRCAKKALAPRAAEGGAGGIREGASRHPPVALVADPGRLAARKLRWVAAEAGLDIEVFERRLVLPAQAESAPWLGPKGLGDRERDSIDVSVCIYALREGGA
ncbi:MAG: protein N-lysine methyltransferase family protein [Planctomycetota bacterium]|nr:protein N-lysine methyltransferase family protein [Planctomycetota bacterium]